MSRYAHINLLDDIEASSRLEGLEARFGRDKLESRDLGISHWRYAPNLKVPVGHRHREQEEAYVVVAGSGRILVDDEVIELRRWDVVRLAPEAVRAFAAGPDGLEIIAIGGPKPEGGDGEQAPVDWPD
jgi:quercetin dioxygenase-like cupin family protein